MDGLLNALTRLKDDLPAKNDQLFWQTLQSRQELIRAEYEKQWALCSVFAIRAPFWIETEPHEKGTELATCCLEFPFQPRRTILITNINLSSLRRDSSVNDDDFRRAIQCIRDWVSFVEAKKLDEPSNAGNSDHLIERLLSGPDDAELTLRELAFLDAYVKKAIPFRETGNRLAKLKLIRNFNRNLPKVNSTSNSKLLPGLSIAPQTANVPDEGEKKSTVDCLPPKIRLAYLAATCAETKNGRTMTDREAWDWLKENGITGADELNDYELPLPETFADYLTKARRALGEQRKQPRGGRTGRTVKRPSEF